MAGSGQMTGGVGPRALAMTAIGWLGLAACLTIVFLGMRAVMDVGGACADGGPYVSAQPCPEGAPAALLLGIFLGFGFGLLASAGGIAMGGIWAATPVLAWSALFGSLGWNFLDYGILNAPAETGIEWGWVIPGAVFWVMAAVPLLGVVSVREVLQAGRSSSTGPAHLPSQSRRSIASPSAFALPGPGQPRRTTSPGQPPRPARTGEPPRTTSPAQATTGGPTREERDQMAGIARDFDAALGAAMDETPADPAARAAQAGLPPWPTEPGAAEPGAVSAAPPDFSEGTQALLDRLERLADLRDRGLLGPAEYETAKAAIMAELEERA